MLFTIYKSSITLKNKTYQDFYNLVRKDLQPEIDELKAKVNIKKGESTSDKTGSQYRKSRVIGRTIAVMVLVFISITGMIIAYSNSVLRLNYEGSISSLKNTIKILTDENLRLKKSINDLADSKDKLINFLSTDIKNKNATINRLESKLTENDSIP